MMNNVYEIVEDFVRAYWKEHHVCDVVILLLLDDVPHEVIAFCESDSDNKTVTFNTDFWEGEQSIEVELIKPLWEVLEYYRDHVKKEGEKDAN